MQTEHICPKCGSRRLFTKIRIPAECTVDENGCITSSIVPQTASPDDTVTWYCAFCGSVAVPKDSLPEDYEFPYSPHEDNNLIIHRNAERRRLVKKVLKLIREDDESEKSHKTITDAIWDLFAELALNRKDLASLSYKTVAAMFDSMIYKIRTADALNRTLFANDDEEAEYIIAGAVISLAAANVRQLCLPKSDEHGCVCYSVNGYRCEYCSHGPDDEKIQKS